MIQVLIATVCLSQVYPFRRFTTRDGLPSNHITALVQDSRGYLWIGTDEGLSVFNSREFRTFTRRDGLPNPLISDIVEDRLSPGSLWVGTGNGLCTFDGRGWSIVYGPPDHPECGIDALYQDHRGTVWFVVRDTIMVVDHGIVRRIRVALPYRSIGQIVESGDSLIWFSHGTGILRYSERTGVFTTLETGRFADHGDRPMYVDRTGDVWIHRLSEDTTYSMLLRFRGTDLVERRTMAAHPGISFMLDDLRGGLLSNGSEGIDRISIDNPASGFLPLWNRENGLPEKDIRAGLMDREGNLWIGGNARGLGALLDVSVFRLPLEGAEAGQRGSVAVSDFEDHLWVVARDGLHEIARDTAFRWHEYLHRFRPDAVSVTLDRHGNLWLAFSDASLKCFRLTRPKGNRSVLVRQKQFFPGRDFPYGFPVTVCLDSSDIVWYSLGGRGVIRIDQRGTVPWSTVFTPSKGASGDYVRALFTDSRGRLWCAPYMGGLFALDCRRPPFVAEVRSGPDERVRDLYEDSRGRIWCGLQSGGVAIVDADTTRITGARGGLPSSSVRCITDDRDGRVWLGTGYGAVRIDSLEPLKFYLKEELCRAPVFSAGRFRCGLLWFLTVEGVTIYDPERDARTIPPSRVQITGLTVNGRPAVFKDEATVPYDQKICTIEFVSPSFRDAGSIKYSYRIEPGEKTWQGPFAEPRVTYSSLSPGMHRFLVYAVNGLGMTSDSPATLVITVESPFWEKGWFVLLVCVLAGVAFAATIRRFELRKLRRKMAMLEQEQTLERERVRIARDMHDEIGSTLTEISILGELGRQSAAEPHEMVRTMDAMAEKSREVLDSITEIIWAINPRNDELNNLASYVRRYTLRFCEHARIGCRILIPDDLPDARLSVEQRRNLFLVVKESLNNIAKHARATMVTLCLSVVQSDLILEIADDGCGFDADALKEEGNGVPSMRHRVDEIGGIFSLVSAPGGGTRVRIYLKRGIVSKKPIR